MSLKDDLQTIFKDTIKVENNFIFQKSNSDKKNQEQTNLCFSEKWTKVSTSEGELESMENFQKSWFLSLYGFHDEKDLASYLSKKKYIVDAGCGLGYKTAWLASLAPDSLVIGVDYSEAAVLAAKKYSHLSNCLFVQGDIANTGFRSNSIDFLLCDQVIMHTENPELTFKHLSEVTKSGGEFACYVYAKKALPRELLDDYFREETHNIKSDDLWKMSEQLTKLGQLLSELNQTIEVPDIPLLGIKGGKYDIQRFIYWNFLKCFYRPDWTTGMCDSTNFDWYSPSNAKRFNESEFKDLITANNLNVTHFHAEEACYSGRFTKVSM